MSKPYVLIVDPFSSGSLFAERVKHFYGLDCIALVTYAALPKSITSTFQRADFLRIFELSSSIELTIADIEHTMGAQPAHIICGSEAGVLIFDQLAAHWNLRPNDVSSSLSRRDKHLMQAQLKAKNLRSIPYIKSNNIEEIISWRREQDFDECVMKPVRSFGTEGVFFITSEQDLEVCFASLIGTIDYFGNLNSEVLVQEKLEGTEYVVDAVSSNGKHFIVNMFRYTKENVNQAPLYRQMTTVPISEHPQIVAYAKEVLDALGIRHGPSHNELILTESGPVLVETGARMHGGQGPKIVEECNSHSLIDLSVHSRISDEVFERETRSDPVLRKFATEFFLMASSSGLVEENNIEKLCGPLESFSFTTCALKKGDFVRETTDLMTSYGRIILRNADLTKLEHDVAVVQALESAGAFLTISPLKDEHTRGLA